MFSGCRILFCLMNCNQLSRICYWEYRAPWALYWWHKCFPFSGTFPSIKASNFFPGKKCTYRYDSVPRFHSYYCSCWQPFLTWSHTGKTLCPPSPVTTRLLCRCIRINPLLLIVVSLLNLSFGSCAGPGCGGVHGSHMVMCSTATAPGTVLWWQSPQEVWVCIPLQKGISILTPFPVDPWCQAIGSTLYQTLVGTGGRAP